MDSAAMRTLITTKLHEDAFELRRLASESSNPRSSLGSVKEKMMREIHLILTLMLGPPPNPNKNMIWEYYDKDDKFCSVSTSPLSLAGELSGKSSNQAITGFDYRELFSIVNDPRNSYGSHLSVNRLGNIIGMRPCRYVNGASFLSGLFPSGTTFEPQKTGFTSICSLFSYLMTPSAVLKKYY